MLPCQEGRYIPEFPEKDTNKLLITKKKIMLCSRRRLCTAVEFVFFRENSDDQVGKGCYTASKLDIHQNFLKKIQMSS